MLEGESSWGKGAGIFRDDSWVGGRVNTVSFPSEGERKESDEEEGEEISSFIDEGGCCVNEEEEEEREEEGKAEEDKREEEDSISMEISFGVGDSLSFSNEEEEEDEEVGGEDGSFVNNLVSFFSSSIMVEFSFSWCILMRVAAS